MAMEPKNELNLTAKQQLFCEHYVTMLNGTRAARAAGYSAESDKSLAVEASRLLRNASVKVYIEKLFAAGKMGKQEVIGRLQALANADIGNYLKVVKVIRNGEEVEEWRFDLVQAIKDDNTSIIKSIKRDKFGVVVELHDKVRTLELIGKHHRLFADMQGVVSKPDATADDLEDDDLLSIAKRANVSITDSVDDLAAQDEDTTV